MNTDGHGYSYPETRRRVSIFSLAMTINSNQKIEEYYFEMFRKDYVLPPGEVKYGDKPDVIIEGPKRIGVEITNFYIEDGSLRESEQVQRNLRENIVSKAQGLYLNGGGRNIRITFSFDKAKPIGNKRGLELKLADLGKRIEKNERGSISRDTFREIPELEFVYLNPKEFQNARWQVQQVYDGSEMPRGQLLKTVREKEKNVSEYQKCDAYWLLVVVDFFDPAQDQEIPNDGFEKIESQEFEKIIVYKTVFGQILEAK